MKRWIGLLLLLELFPPTRVLYSMAGMLERRNNILGQRPGLPVAVTEEGLPEVSGFLQCWQRRSERQSECKPSSGRLP
ncbi:hypothetical protein QBC41DRAFT_323178 [Cercophora samala]|uniref:Uncharacterized protein n=1 Tax=Cercophora samala TaxID=330535 RepID=A0AA39ZBA1_9PEZI|nr:hypothetical protein QBC41DRAFT_323178 [Cercophora samala]